MSESGLSGLKQFLVGRPIPSHLAHHERLSKTTGLAVLSSDALSSVAYATEEVLRTLLIAGTGALALVTPIGAVIAGLLRRPAELAADRRVDCGHRFGAVFAEHPLQCLQLVFAVDRQLGLAEGEGRPGIGRSGGIAC
jgi:hypothetical protein